MLLSTPCCSFILHMTKLKQKQGSHWLRVTGMKRQRLPQTQDPWDQHWAPRCLLPSLQLPPPPNLAPLGPTGPQIYICRDVLSQRPEVSPARCPFPRVQFENKDAKAINALVKVDGLEKKGKMK